eukprot:1672761-Pyramimonas_sp.AAC.1
MEQEGDAGPRTLRLAARVAKRLEVLPRPGARDWREGITVAREELSPQLMPRLGGLLREYQSDD